MNENKACTPNNPLRTDETEAKYQSDIKDGHLNDECIFCTIDTVKEFEYWKISTNKYPYDKIACVHDMLYPKRHTDGSDLTPDETKELKEIKNNYLDDCYQFIVEPVPSRKSVPGHFHLHIIITNI